MGIVRGFLAPFHGAGFVVQHGLWRYLWLPFALTLVLVVALGTASFFVFDQMFAGHGWSSVSAVVIGVVVSVLAFFVTQPIVTAPFLDALSERCEVIATGHAPSVGVVRSAWLALAHGIPKVLLYALALGGAAVSGAVFPLAGVVVGAVGFALFATYDAFDYPLGRRGLGFGDKWRYLARHPGLTIGHGLGWLLLCAIPGAALLAPSLAAAGATLAYLKAEKAIA